MGVTFPVYRVRVLRDHKEKQLDDLRQLESSRGALTNAAEALAERHDDSNERQQQLIHRSVTSR